MKTLSLLSLILFYYLNTNAQCSVLTNEVDEFTGKKTILMKQQYMGNAFVTVGKYDSTYIISFIGGDVGCSVTGKSKVLLKMSDDSILEFLHVGRLDCKGSTSIVVDATPFFDELTSNDISAIRIVGSQGQIDFKVNKNSDYVRKNLVCVQRL